MHQMIRFFSLLIVPALIGVACSTEPGLDEKINTLESKALSETKLDTALGDSLLQLYRLKLKEGNEPNLLFKAGELAYNLPGEHTRAMEYLKRMYIKYPEHEDSPKALFYLGLIYENILHDREKSAQTWEDFLVRYPSHELADNAADLLTLARDTMDDLERVQMWLKSTNNNEK